MKKKLLYILSAIFLAYTTGCQKPEPISNPVSLSSDNDTDAVWLACKEELRSRGFIINFQNRDAGIIETSPLPSKQWFEFWKNDVVDAGGLAKSSTQSTRRTVTLNIDDSKVKCTVAVNKLYTSSLADSNQPRKDCDLFSNEYFLEKKKVANQVWSPSGNDPALEKDILRHIKSRLED